MKPWLRQSTASLPPEVERVVHPVPPPVLERARAATASTSEECAAFSEHLPPTVLDGIRRDTGSSAEELVALARRLRAHPASARGPLLLPGLAFALALLVCVPTALVLAQLEPPAPAPASITAGPLVLAAGVVHPLSPDIRVEGEGLLRVDRLHDAGADVTVLSGWGRFHVEPQGQARALRVAAADVQVQVQGTVFSVANLSDAVRVTVDRGRVQVLHEGRAVHVGAGESWERAGASAASERRTVSAAIQSADAAVLRAETMEPPEPDQAEPPADEPGSTMPPARSAAPARATAQRAGRDAGPPDPPTGRQDPSAGVTMADPNDPCAEDLFSRACVETRRPAVDPASESRLFEALTLAMLQIGTDVAADRTTVEACNRFLEQHPESERADDVRAFRVQASLTGARPSQVVRWADAYLASAAADHPQRAQVERWRALAALRGEALDSAQTGACDDALPLLRELVQVEQGDRREHAIAWRGVCAAAVGNRDEARRALRSVREHTLPADLRRRVTDAWATIR